jgi:hypothetical protein
MAAFLAIVLNGVECGESLPTPGEQHRPQRFQLTHDPMGFAPGAAVVYMHRSKGRIVASAQDDETARQIARILNHVDYPMRDAGVLVPKVGVVGEPPSDLPESIVAPQKRRRRKS